TNAATGCRIFPGPPCRARDLLQEGWVSPGRTRSGLGPVITRYAMGRATRDCDPHGEPRPHRPRRGPRGSPIRQLSPRSVGLALHSVPPGAGALVAGTHGAGLPASVRPTPWHSLPALAAALTLSLGPGMARAQVTATGVTL